MKKRSLEQITKQKEELIKQFEQVKNSVTKEELEKATPKEVLEYTKMVLEIKMKLEIIEQLEKEYI